MGVLNVTPDSFYDGGQYLNADDARLRVDQLLADGADLLDIGGESSRPGAAPVPAAEQIARIEPAVTYACSRGALVSVDTTDPVVAEHVLGLGAGLINDISCLANAELARVCAAHGATLILMHSRGSMQKMEGFSRYPDENYPQIVEEVRSEWSRARDRAVRAGLEPTQIFFDPGLGFHKNARHSYQLLRNLDCFRAEEVPIVVGASRKSFLGSVDDAPPEARLGGSIAAALFAVDHGASILRVHDVRETQQALLVMRALRGEQPAEAFRV